MDDAILVIDDELNFRHSIKYLLENAGYSTDLAESGKEALICLQNNTYQAVLLDLLLPDIDGIEIAEYITQHHPDTAVIILTGHATVDTAVLAMRCGVYDYLNKPSKPELVLQIIHRGIENRRLKQELLASKKKFQRLADATWEGLAFYNDDRLVQVNRQLCDLFGYSEEELVGCSIREIIEDWQACSSSLKQNLLSQSAVVEAIGIHRDGSFIPVEIRIKKISEADETTWVAAIRDISARKREEMNRLKMQEELANALRMESIGLMAGSVAHDLNNILTSIVTFPELLLLDMSITEKYRQDISLIQQAGKQAAAVVADLLTVVRGATSKKEFRNINALLNDYQNSIECSQLADSHPGIAFEFQLAPDLMITEVSVIHIAKSISNLITNGAEAMEGHHGRVTVKTFNRSFQTLREGYEDIPSGTYVVLAVTDTGPGIPQEVLPRIFEPFFSKKELGRSGTGLGLTIIKNTARDHRGFIDVTCDGSGTCFELYFPVSEEQESADSSALNLDSLFGKGEEILIVDDEKSQLNTTSSLLKRLGYSPTTAESGKQAIDHIRKKPVDLLLLDMWMPPGISGYETYKQILEIQPDQKAVITSGYFSPEDLERMESLGITQHLTKPFSLTNLAKALQQEIDRQQPGKPTTGVPA